MREPRNSGREDPDVVLPLEPVFAAEVVLDGVGEADAELDRVDFAPPQLGGGERCGGELAPRDVVRGRDADVDPD